MQQRDEVGIWRAASLFAVLLSACSAKHESMGTTDAGLASDASNTSDGSSRLDGPDADMQAPALVGTCPLAKRTPIPMPMCDDSRESSEGKWSEMDSDRWQSSGDAHLVVIRVRGGLMPCPETMEDGAAYDFRKEWNRHAQSCVRELIDHLGGHARDDVEQANIVVAELTWSQIQEVRKLRDVLAIRDMGRSSSPD